MLDHWSNAHRKRDLLLLCGGRNAIIETTCVVETESANISLSVFFTPLFPNLMALLSYALIQK